MYTNVSQRGNSLYLRGVENGRRFKHKVDYQPTVWVSSKSKNATDPWSTLDGRTVYSLKPGSIYDTKKFLETYKDVHGMDVYESPGNVYQYIAAAYPGDIQFNFDDLRISIIDIENKVEAGFCKPEVASEEILLITLKDVGTDKTITWGRKPFGGNIPNNDYRYFEDEGQLLRDFLAYWQNNYPDILTGWNSNFYDVTYLYTRICKVLGENFANKLSPWGRVEQREVVAKWGKTGTKTLISGVACLDYMELYTKFGTYSAKESYKLGDICFDEIKEEKVKNPGDTFKEFYDLYWDTFVVYNVRDVTLVEALDNKKKLLALAATIAYAAKINFEDVFSPVKCWDIIIYNYLNDRKIVVPPRRNNVKKEQYEGAYVKEPIPGRYKWCVSFDLTSLYPHIIWQNNMSPETIVDFLLPVTVEGLLNKTIDLTVLKEEDFAMSANGQCFKRDKIGLLPVLMEKFYNQRNDYKTQMLDAKKRNESEKTQELAQEIAKFSSHEQAFKILLNSAYGAIGNPYSRWYDIRIAEGITLTGQLAIQWIANRLNAFLNKTLKTVDKDFVVMIDTDSVVLNLEALVEAVYPGRTTEETISYLDRVSREIFQPFITKQFEEMADYTNAYLQKMFMKRENIVDVMLSVCKKKYVMNVHDSEGVRYKEPYMKVMGLQMVQASTPAIIRKSLRASLPAVLHGTEKDVQAYVKKFKAEFDKFTPEQIAFPKSVNNMTKYSHPATIYTRGKGAATPIHVRGSLLFNHYVKKKGLGMKYPLIQEGDKIRYLYLKMPNPIFENVIAFQDELPPEFELVTYVDYDMMFIKTFQDPVQGIIEPMKWSAESRATLDDFFLD